MKNQKSKIIDFDTFNDLLRYTDKEGLIEIYKDFEVEMNSFLVELKSLNIEKERDEILSILHTVKGSAASLGIFEISDYAKEAEAQIKNFTMSAKCDIYEELLELYVKFTDNYERLLKLW